ncbi:hypothetical protein DFP72DRAFT_856345 [Ephemerocybe angulata]|uniref:Uncharacterized protein n=1 Tax=Ephemerocybe angulata TaxID=980116 RepID=A0A8H6LWR4_9AGAR|nr:hypothetical protein DFP72DRAFT_856345 [Tulosesus angulatus]
MAQVQAAITPGECLARRLLANCATGAVSNLRALVHSYPYHHSDLRPFQLVMSLLRDSPSLRSRGPDDRTPEPLTRALVCLDIIHHVARATVSSPLSYGPFSQMLKEHWSTILSWLTFSLEYPGEMIPRERVILLAIYFLTDYGARPPFAPNTIEDWETVVDLVFRTWSGEFNQGTTLTKVTVATVEFFDSCLCLGGSAKAAVLDLFFDLNRARSFFKSFATQLTALNPDADETPSGAHSVLLMHEFCIYLVECLSKTPNWVEIWKLIVKEGALKAYTSTAFTLLSIPIFVPWWKVAQVGKLLRVVEENTEGILSRVARLSRADLAPLLGNCIETMGAHGGASELMIVGHLRYLASYLPYQSVSKAVIQSLERQYAARPWARPPLSIAGWNLFHSTLRLCTMSAAKRNAYYAFACDNTKHLALRVQENSPSGEDFTSRKSAKVTIGSLSIVTSVPVLLVSLNWFPWGSKRNPGALLINTFNLLYLIGIEVGPAGAVTILDWTLGAPAHAESRSRDDYLASVTGRSPSYAGARIDAIISTASAQTGTRLVEATFRHGRERIHVLAMLREGHWPGGYTFLNGVGTIRREGDSGKVNIRMVIGVCWSPGLGTRNAVGRDLGAQSKRYTMATVARNLQRSTIRRSSLQRSDSTRNQRLQSTKPPISIISRGRLWTHHFLEFRLRGAELGELQPDVPGGDRS